MPNRAKGFFSSSEYKRYYSLVGCAVTFPGKCEKVCKRPGPFGTFVDCASKDSSRRGDDRKDDSTGYAETITVFLPAL